MSIQERINSLMEKESFAEDFSNASTAKEIVDLFGRNGVDVPMEIAEELFDPTTQEESELNEESLDDVTGGGAISDAIGLAYYGAGYLGGRLAGWSKSDSKKYAKNCKKIGSLLGTAIELLS